MSLGTMKLAGVLLLLGLSAQICAGTSRTRLTNVDSFFNLFSRFRKPSGSTGSGPTVATDTTTCFDQPECPSVHDHRFVSFDGTCNNRVDKNRGRASRAYKRFLPADYGDETGSPRTGSNGRALPSSRLVSTTMRETTSRKASTATHLVPLWGQFIVHDMASTPVVDLDADGNPIVCSCDNPEPDCFNIEIPEDDAQRSEKKCFKIKRALAVADSNTDACDATVRQQLNEISGYIDAGTVYGNSEEFLAALMDPKSEIGELNVQRLRYHGTMPHLPLESEVNQTIAERMHCPHKIRKPKNLPCFVAGDVRVNENSALTTQHTIWMIKHNQIVRDLKRINPSWKGSLIFKTARSIVTAIQQIVTYGQFLPVVLGEKYMERYQLSLLKKGLWYGYDSTYDGTIVNSFNTAAFRFGHSMISNLLTRPSPSWKEEQGSSMAFQTSFFNAVPIMDESHGGMNSIARGFVKQNAMQVDTTFVSALNDFLFAEQGKFGLDLMAINIQRGRDHGLPSYNKYREFCGLKKATSFDDFVEIDGKNRLKLKKLYNNNVDDVDLYIAGVAELPVEGGSVGPTFACIIAHQFRDIKKGDRFWHENGGVFQYFTEDQLDTLRETTYSRILCDISSDMLTIQSNPMSIASNDNPLRKCASYAPLNINAWKDGAPLHYYADGRENEEKDSQWSTWFPTSTRGGVQLTPAQTLNHLLRHRPDEVCDQILDTEQKRVNGRLLVRFQCPPGLIKFSDFPVVESEEVYWSEWSDNSHPSSDDGDDDELRMPGKQACFQPLAIQAQTTTDGVPAGETGEVFQEFSASMGLLCKAHHQRTRRCQDYQVRYLCRKGEDTVVPTSAPTVKPSASSKWTKWISTDTPDNNGDIEYLYRARRLSRTVCRRPIGMEVRTVDGKTPVSESSDIIRKMEPQHGFLCYNVDQPNDRKCKDYEVRYKCEATSSTPYSVQRQTKYLCSTFNVCC